MLLQKRNFKQYWDFINYVNHNKILLPAFLCLIINFYIFLRIPVSLKIDQLHVIEVIKKDF